MLGGYSTLRHVVNAWNRVVLQGIRPRDALEEAVKLSTRESIRKREEFGLARVVPAVDRMEGIGDAA